VTLTGELGALPIALTTTTLFSENSRIISCATPLMRSALAMQVPPNLWISQNDPLGVPEVEVDGASASTALTTATLRDCFRSAARPRGRAAWGARIEVPAAPAPLLPTGRCWATLCARTADRPLLFTACERCTPVPARCICLALELVACVARANVCRGSMH
jgi:hypothetical protein